MGIILVADGIAESLSPMFVGALYKTTNNYKLGFSILICIALAEVLIVFFLPELKQSTDIS